MRCVVLVLDKGQAHIEEVEYEETALTIETVSDEQTRPRQTMLMQPRSFMQEVTVQLDLTMACLLPCVYDDFSLVLVRRVSMSRAWAAAQRKQMVTSLSALRLRATTR